MSGGLLAVGAIAVLAGVSVAARGSRAMTSSQRIESAVFEVVEAHEDSTGLGAPFDAVFLEVRRELRRHHLYVDRDDVRRALKRYERMGYLYTDATGWRLG